MNPTFHCKRLVIIGVGLMGGSLALALRAQRAVDDIVGVGRNPENLNKALALGVIDRAHSLNELAQACAGADIIVLAVPVAQTAALCRALAPHLDAHTIVTDVGSTKQDVVAAAQTGLGEKFLQFVPAHPIAGSEQNGVAAARVDLYQDRHVVVCPTTQNRADDVQRIRQLWAATGARLVTLDVTQHDAVFATISHLPHLLAFAYMNHVLQTTEVTTKLELAGAGFRDFSRIAGGSPDMWVDIALANRTLLLNEMAAYQTQLNQWMTALHNADRATLRQLMETASNARRDWKI